MKRRIISSLILAAGFLFPHYLAAQSNYPNKPITILVGSSPGSATDLAARFAASILQEKYKVPTIVENKSGASGVIAMSSVASAKPDGYTLQLGGLGHNVIPPVTRTNLPLNIPKEIIPIAQAAEFINILLVPEEHPANSIPELIEYLKQTEGLPLYGTNGVGSSSHMTSELFSLHTGIEFEPVHYRATNDALLGAVNGDLDFIFMNIPPALPLIESGRLKTLAVTSKYPARQFPDAPTMEEQGVEGFDVTSWLGVYGPAGMPQELIDELSEVLVDGFSSPEYKEKMINAGFEPKARHAKEFAEHNSQELQRWGEVAEHANIKVPYGN